MERPWYTYYEREVPTYMEFPEVPLYYFVERSAKRFPENVAVHFYGRDITYRKLWDYIGRFATALHRLGVKKGDRVSLMLPNSPQFLIGFYGALRLGAIVVQTNPLYVERELEFILKDSEAETIITLDSFHERISNVRDKTPLKRVIYTRIQHFFAPHLKFLYSLKLKIEGKYPKPRDGIFMEELIRTNPIAPPKVDINPKEDIALFQYTGGTTGTPKAAMLTHYNLVVNTIQTVTWYTGMREGKEVIMGALPFFHVYGMTVAMNFAMRVAGKLVLVPRFRVEEIVKLIEKHKVTLFPGAPTMYVAVINMKDVKKYDLSSIEACISGSAPLPLKVKEDFEKLTGAKLVEGYGLSEASPVTHCNPIYGLNKPGSIGIPFPSTDAKIVDLETGERELPPNEIGELVVRGPQVMKGYWKRLDETEDVLKDGWLYTGDIARMDKDGYFYIVDRKKDMIISGGYNVYPREVEEVLYQHPKVKEAAVIGLPDKYKGEAVKAIIVLKKGETATEEEIIEFCKKNLAKYKVPKIVEFRDSLPKTFVGKVLRRVLREEEREKGET